MEYESSYFLEQAYAHLLDPHGIGQYNEAIKKAIFTYLRPAVERVCIPELKFGLATQCVLQCQYTGFGWCIADGTRTRGGGGQKVVTRRARGIRKKS